MEAICGNCRHFRQYEEINAATGLRETKGYCKASRNYAKHELSDTCKRYHYDEQKVYEF